MPDKVHLVHYVYIGKDTTEPIIYDRRSPVIAVFREKGNAWRFINGEKRKYTGIGIGAPEFWIEEMEVSD